MNHPQGIFTFLSFNEDVNNLFLLNKRTEKVKIKMFTERSSSPLYFCHRLEHYKYSSTCTNCLYPPPAFPWLNSHRMIGHVWTCSLSVDLPSNWFLNCFKRSDNILKLSRFGLIWGISFLQILCPTEPRNRVINKWGTARILSSLAIFMNC